MSVQIDYAIFEKFRKQSELKKYLQENPRFKCEECNEILIEPYQTDCGNRYCYLCIKQWSDNLRTCPGCNETISSIKENVIPDKAMEKEISKLKIKCINAECVETLFFKDLKEHLQICKFREEMCVYCNESSKNLKEHLAYKCRKTMIECPDCGEMLIREKMETIHRNINVQTVNDLCPNWSRLCPYNCCDIKLDNIKFHLQICPKGPVKCVLAGIGCKKIVTEESMNDHIKNDEIDHSRLLTNFLLKLISEQNDIKLQILEKEKLYISDISDIKRSTSSCNKLISQHTSNVFERDQVVEKLKKEIKTLANFPVHKPLSDNLIVQTVSSSHNNVEFLWTLTNIVQKIQDAKNDIRTQISSEPFYLNIPGYRMRLKIYPNGDGIAKNNFLSIYFVIVKGEYDNDISWPFNRKITLSLVKHDHTILSTLISMRPDNNITCYGKPIDESNIGSGQPKFIRISELMNSNECTNDGSLIIKLNVEL